MMICLPAAKSTVRTFYSDWMPSGADNAIFLMEVIYSDLGTSLTASVLTKAHESAGTEGTSAGSFSALSTTGLWRATSTGLKDLVRFKIEVPTIEEEGTGSTALIRFVPTTWYPTSIPT